MQKNICMAGDIMRIKEEETTLEDFKKQYG